MSAIPALVAAAPAILEQLFGFFGRKQSQPDPVVAKQIADLSTQIAAQQEAYTALLLQLKEQKIDSFDNLESHNRKLADALVDLAKRTPAAPLEGHNVGFFGHTSSGKSTLLNALLGQQVAAVGHGETTLEMKPYQGVGQRLWDFPGRNDEVNYLTLPYITCMKGLSKVVVLVESALSNMSSIMRLLSRLDVPFSIVVNKLDLCPEAERESFKRDITAERDRLYPASKLFFISAREPLLFRDAWESLVHELRP